MKRFLLRLSSDSSGLDQTLLQKIISSVKKAQKSAEQTLTDFQSLIFSCDKWVEEMDFSFLLDKESKIFTIGFNVEEEKPDKSFYDLLASESRLASFVAIAKGDVPQEHWFRLGRPLTPFHGSRALVSWTATMFEYLMPILVMRDYNSTLLDQTYKSIVARQIEYGRKNGVPWGVSEAAYNARDLQLNYQYAPFGVPGLGLKRGLSDDLVVSPYSTALAAQISPHLALENFAALEKIGALARYGFYESIDYTPRTVATKNKSGDHPRVYGASSGNDFGRARQSSARRCDAKTFSQRTARTGDGISFAGKNSARRSGFAAARRRSFVGSHRSFDFRSCDEIFRHADIADTAHPNFIERQIFRDGDEFRRGLFDVR